MVHIFSNHILYISTHLYHNWCLYQSCQALKIWNNCQKSQIVNDGHFWSFLGHFCSSIDWTWVVHTFCQYIFNIYIPIYIIIGICTNHFRHLKWEIVVKKTQNSQLWPFLQWYGLGMSSTCLLWSYHIYIYLFIPQLVPLSIISGT